MQNIEKFFKNNKKIILCSFITTFLVFGFICLNSVVNIDGVKDLILHNKENDATIYISMGRWAWALILKVFNFYPSGTFILLFNGFLFAMSTILFCKIFEIKKVIYQIIINVFMISFPINVYMFGYFSWQYTLGIGVFCSILSVYLLKYYKNNYLSMFCNILLITFTIAIYQSFIPFLIVLILGLGLSDINKNRNNKDLIKKYAYYLIMFVVSCLLYMILSNLFIKIFDIKWNTYSGASTMFEINLISIIKNIPSFLKECFIPNNIYYYPIFLQIVLNSIVFFTILVNLKNVNKKCMCFYILISMLLFVCPKILMLLKPESWYHTLTLISYLPLYLYCIGLIFKNIESFKSLEKVMLVILFIICTVFIINDNKLSYMGKLSSDASFAYINRLQMRIEQLDGYMGPQVDKKLYIIGGKKWGSNSNDKSYVLDVGPTATFIFDGISIENGLNVLGDKYTLVNDKLSAEEIYNINDIANYRKCYPSNESIFKYNDIIVVKMM